MGYVKGSAARYRSNSMDDFLEYRARQEVGKIRQQVVSEKRKALARRGECKKGWKKAYEASGEMDRDIEAAKRGIVYLRSDAASDPAIVREYEAVKTDMRLTGMMETGCFNELTFDVDLLIDRMIDYFTEAVREERCGCFSCAGDVPRDHVYWDIDGSRIEREVDQKEVEEYFKYLVEGRLYVDIVWDTMTDVYGWTCSGENGPAFDLLHEWFLEQNPDIRGLLAQVPSCGAVGTYIEGFIGKRIELFEFVAEQVCEGVNAMSGEEYLALNLENDDEARDLYDRYILGI